MAGMSARSGMNVSGAGGAITLLAAITFFAAAAKAEPAALLSVAAAGGGVFASGFLAAGAYAGGSPVFAGASGASFFVLGASLFASAAGAASASFFFPQPSLQALTPFAKMASISFFTSMQSVSLVVLSGLSILVG